MRILFLLLASSFLLGCKPSTTITSSTPIRQRAVTQRNTTKIEGCGLITKEEVGAIQNTTVTDAKSSEGSDGSHLMTQCYYATTGPNLSVSIAVTQFDPNNVAGPSPRELWEQTFGQFRNGEGDPEKKEKEEREEKKEAAGSVEREGEERRVPPKKIEGVGEEAFWEGSRFGGALYALKGDVFIRISVGGADNQEGKIEKSKNLAQKALGRLP